MRESMSVINTVRTDQVKHTAATDDGQALLAVRYHIGTQRAYEESNDVHTITVDADGSDSSEVLVTVEIGPTGSTTSYLFSGDGAAGAETAAATLGDLVDELNDIDGVEAYVLNGASDLALTSALFIDVAATDLSKNFQEILYRDLSAVFASAVRIGIPEVRDSGRIALVGINGTATGVTNGTLTIYRDDHPQGGTKTELDSFALVAAETEYINQARNEPSIYRGPLLVEIASDDLSACNIKVRTRNVEY